MNRYATFTPRHRRAACHCSYRTLDFLPRSEPSPTIRIPADNCPAHPEHHRNTAQERHTQPNTTPPHNHTPPTPRGPETPQQAPARTARRATEES